MSIDTGAICVTCKRELIYSEPKEDDDTTTKSKAEAGVHMCLSCTKQAIEKRKQATRERKQERVKKKEEIKKNAENKTKTFERLWNDVDEQGNPKSTLCSIEIEGKQEDVKLLNLVDDERLIWIYKNEDIIIPIDGFLDLEESKTIKAKEIERITQQYMQDKQEALSNIHNNLMGQEAGERRLKQIEEIRKAEMRRVISSVNKLHSIANAKQEQITDVHKRETFVKDHGFKDQYGQLAPRWFLLSDGTTYAKRKLKREHQKNMIDHRDRIEKEISEKNQRHFDEKTGALAT